MSDEILNRTRLQKMHAAAPFLDEPACTELRKCIDALFVERANARLGWESARSNAIQSGSPVDESEANAAIARLDELGK